MSVNIQRKTFSTSEYHHMAEAGILREDDRIELIEGEIISMAAIGSYHAACVNRLNQLFTGILSDTVIVSVQNPVTIGDFSEPEPDIALLKPRPDFYAQGHPEPEDVLLIIEVADTSLEYDRDVKIPLYAKAGVTESWIANLGEACVDVYSDPSGWTYKTKRIFRKRDILTPKAFPGIKIPVDEIIRHDLQYLTVD